MNMDYEKERHLLPYPSFLLLSSIVMGSHTVYHCSQHPAASGADPGVFKKGGRGVKRNFLRGGGGGQAEFSSGGGGGGQAEFSSGGGGGGSNHLLRANNHNLLKTKGGGGDPPGSAPVSYAENW